MAAILTAHPINTTPLAGAPSTGALTTFTITTPGASTGRSEFTVPSVGARKLWQEMPVKTPGRYNIALYPYTSRGIGARKGFETITLVTPGMASVSLVPITITTPGAAKQFQNIRGTMPGASVLRGTIIVPIRAPYRMLSEFVHNTPGAAQVGRGYVVTTPGVFGLDQPVHTRTYRQGYRVADAGMDRWELYLGYDAMPDFEAGGQPVATSTSLPFTFSPTLPGPGLTTILHSVVRKRTQYNLLAHNMEPMLLEIDENGDEVQGPLTAPELTKLLDGSAAGSLQVWARYAYGPDRNPADTWELYAEEDADPVVGVDTPVVEAPMGSLNGGNTPWRAAVTGLTPGATYHVLVVVRRGNDDAYEASVVGTITLAPVYDIDQGDITVFGGTEYEAKSL